MNVKKQNNTQSQQQHQQLHPGVNQGRSNNNILIEENNKHSINSSSSSNTNNRSSNPFIQQKPQDGCNESNSQSNSEEEDEGEENEEDIIAQKHRLLGKNLPDGKINNQNIKNNQVNQQDSPQMIKKIIQQPQQNTQPVYPQQQQSIYPNQLNNIYYPNMNNNPPFNHFQPPIPMMSYPFPSPLIIPNIAPILPQYHQGQLQHYQHQPQNQQQFIPSNNQNNNSNKQEEELMQLKVKLSNIETENVVLHDKIKELLKTKPSSLLPKTSQKEVMIIKDLTMKINELELERKTEQDNIMNKLDHKEKDYNRLVFELKEKNDAYSKLNNEKDRLVNYIDTLKKDISNYKKENERLETDNNRLYEQVSLTESKFEEMTQKRKENEAFIKSIKSDYEILNQKYFALKKENEKQQNDLANYKEQNFFVKENKPKQSLDIPKRNNPKITDQYNPMSSSIRNKPGVYKTYSNHNQSDENDDADQNEYNDNDDEEMSDEQYKEKRYDNKERLKSESNIKYSQKSSMNIPSHLNKQIVNNKRTNNDSTATRTNNVLEEKRSMINQLKETISKLVPKKERIENELFKIPDRNKTAKDIQDQKVLEKRLDQIERQLNSTKRQLRELIKDD